jgi:lysophospholipid acyltransferase (LPLAT)-like uncharacterized protein
MDAEKKIPLKQRFFLWLGSKVAGKIIWLLKRTVKLEIVGQEHLDGLMNDGGKAIFAFWHGNMIIPMMEHIGSGVHVLVSQHGDGEIIARILTSLGYGLVRGSSTRGGSEALKTMIRLFRKQGIIGITPDGPKGPYRELKIGAVILAQSTGVPVLPMSAYTSSPKFLNSWDKLLVVKPFTRCVLMYGKPVKINREETSDGLEEKRKIVEQSIKDLDQKSENYFST